MIVELSVLFFAISLLYSIVGFGGGSSYLAMLSLFGFEMIWLRSVALFCNLLVSTQNLVWHQKFKDFSLKESLPFVVTSVPMAFLLAKFRLTEKTFFLILAATLFITGILMLLKKEVEIASFWKKYRTLKSMVIGFFIGAISGLVGIGGGIFLSPILHLGGFLSAKKITAICSFFILMNSISGLVSQASVEVLSSNSGLFFYLAIAVLLGSFLGNYLGKLKMNPSKVRQLTAVLIILVAFRLLLKYT